MSLDIQNMFSYTIFFQRLGMEGSNEICLLLLCRVLSTFLYTEITFAIFLEI